MKAPEDGLVFRKEMGIDVEATDAGGVGITRIGFRTFETLVDDARRLIAECPCKLGCPSCVQSPKCGNLNEPLNKNGALEVMTRMQAA